MASTLSLALTGGGYGGLNATVCVRNVASDTIVATVQLPAGGLPKGWSTGHKQSAVASDLWVCLKDYVCVPTVTIAPPDDTGFPAATYDIALQSSSGDVAWLSGNFTRKSVFASASWANQAPV